MKIELSIKKEYDIKYILALAGVRYWEDATVNGIEDTAGDLIPCRNGDLWEPLINIDSGIIVNWKPGTTASVHYKVCDEGTYILLDADKNVIKEIDGYVPSIMCPQEEGYGDYIIMEIDADGQIKNWQQPIDEFLND